MTALRKIMPLPIPAGIAVPSDFGAKPVVRWESPTLLYVDAIYQRDLTERSGKLIRRMFSDFRWNRLKPPVVVEVGDRLHVVDGQHTAIVAASLGIPKIPIFIVEAVALDERARAFVGHNTDRVIVTPISIYQALVAAGEPEALEVA